MMHRGGGVPGRRPSVCVVALLGGVRHSDTSPGPQFLQQPTPLSLGAGPVAIPCMSCCWSGAWPEVPAPPADGSPECWPTFALAQNPTNLRSLLELLLDGAAATGCSAHSTPPLAPSLPSVAPLRAGLAA